MRAWRCGLAAMGAALKALAHAPVLSPADKGSVATIDINQNHVFWVGRKAVRVRKMRFLCCLHGVRVGQMFGTFSLASPSPDGWSWHFRRNCCVSPRQLLVCLVPLVLASVAVAAVCWSIGAAWVLPFTLLELLALSVAFAVHARHATDQECITLNGGHLLVERECGGHRARYGFVRHAVRVEHASGTDQLIVLFGGGRVVRVGQHLRRDLRPQLAWELRRALGC